MSRYRLRPWRRNRVVDINMAPLIDMTFILLIFFLVTTSFVQQTGVEVERPAARTATAGEAADLTVVLDADGIVRLDGHPADLRRVQLRAERLHSQRPDGGVLVLADRRAPTGDLVSVLDACRLAGINRLRVAARPTDGS